MKIPSIQIADKNLSLAYEPIITFIRDNSDFRSVILISSTCCTLRTLIDYYCQQIFGKSIRERLIENAVNEYTKEVCQKHYDCSKNLLQNIQTNHYIALTFAFFQFLFYPKFNELNSESYANHQLNNFINIYNNSPSTFKRLLNVVMIDSFNNIFCEKIINIIKRKLHQAIENVEALEIVKKKKEELANNPFLYDPTTDHWERIGMRKSTQELDALLKQKRELIELMNLIVSYKINHELLSNSMEIDKASNELRS